MSRDYTAAIQSLIDQGGVVELPPGTYTVSNPAPLTGSHALDVTRDGTRIVGAGEGVTTIRLADNQPKFTRGINAEGRSKVVIEGITYHGNAAGQASGNDSEQQHGIFVNASSDVTIRYCEVTGTGGDGVYWYNGSARPRLIGCTIHGTNRVGLHAQWFTDGLISGCHFHGANAESHVKSELDGEGELTRGLTIAGCTFEGDASSNGILLGGLSATTPFRGVSISGNTFRGLLLGVGIGIYGRDWSINGNTIIDCASGIASTNYSTDYGYDAQRNLSIVGNTITGLSAMIYETPAIGVFNCRGATIDGNAIESAGGYGIVILHSEGVAISGRRALMSAADAVGLFLYRSKGVMASGLQLDLSGGSAGSAGIRAADDATYPSSDLMLGPVHVLGTPAVAVDGSNLSGCDLDARAVVAPHATARVAGARLTP